VPDADWLQGCKGGTPPCSNLDCGARLTEFELLATLSRCVRTVLRWDPLSLSVTKVPDAERYVEGTYRKGWELPV
jgi:hypothetical protein